MNPANFYSELKFGLEATLGSSDDVLHIHAGLLIYLFATTAFGRGLGSRLPIALVYLTAFGNELIDLFSALSMHGPWEAAMDITNTVFWPTVLFLIARRHRALAPYEKPGSASYFEAKYLRNVA